MRDGRHDSDFIHGRWQARNKRLAQRLVGSDDWEVFDATDECRPLLGGIGNIEQGRLPHEDAVVELRQYTLQPGQRDVLVEVFEREFIETQEAVGMHVIGQFVDLDAPDRLVWLRGFPSMDARREALQAFYFGTVWKRHRDVANATMIDSDNVLLLKPARPDSGVARAAAPRPGHGATAPAGALCIGICALAAPAEQGFSTRFEQQLTPLLRQHGAKVIASYGTDASENTFPRLPVREGEQVFVWLARFHDVAALDAHLAALRGSAAWQEALAAAMLEELGQPPELLRLVPTARSELR